MDRERSLTSLSPWGRKELDTTEQLTHTHTHTQFMHIHYHIAKKNTHFLLQILIMVLKYAAPWALLYMNTEVKNQNSFLSSLDHKGILSAIFSRKEKKKKWSKNVILPFLCLESSFSQK